MDTNIFASMLFGKDPAEAYIESAEGKQRIHIVGILGAVTQILIDKKIATNDEFEKYKKKVEEMFKDQLREEFKKLFQE